MTLGGRVAANLRERPAGIAAPPPSDETVRTMAARMDAMAQQRLGRSLAIRAVAAGGCNGCELELHALTNIVYDLERFGLRFVTSPRHADVLLVTGPLTRNMDEALRLAWDATPDPKWVLAVGDCAIDGGVFKGSYACLDGVSTVPVDLIIRGCPPTPLQMLDGLRSLLEANATRSAR